MVARVAFVESGGHDTVVLHEERLRVEEHKDDAMVTLADAVARREASRQAVAPTEAERELEVSKVELDLKAEEKGWLAEELAAMHEVLKTREIKLEAARSETNRAKLVLT
uniref:Uncharacterized protein n=1 Tax=Oryza punctata TaxID=4537 RepID=A0A0E0LBU8_ORYPU